MKQKYNYVGKINKSHGIKGEVKVESNSRYIDERFKVGSTLYIKEKNEYIPIVVRSKRGTNDKLIIGFEGYDNPESLFTILHKALYGIKDNSILREGDHFYSSYKGASVYQNDELKGTVKDIVSYPQSDYLVIETLDKKEKLVPLLNEFIEDLDEEENSLYIKDIEGLLWLNSMY